MSGIELESGELTFTIKAGGESREWVVDLIIAKLAAEKLEEQHQLKQQDGAMIPTTEFLCDLAASYDRLGATGITTTAAKHVWIIVAAKFIQLTDVIESQIENLTSEDEE